MKTYTVSENDIERSWYVLDAKDQVLGRLATRIATILRGKHKPTYSPHLDLGDHIVVINAEKVRVTGKKASQKTYHRHSGYPGGATETSFAQMLERHPERILQLAVRGMLPKNRLGRKMLKKLKIYAGPEHPHQAQQPQEMEL